MATFFKHTFLSNRFFIALGICALMFVLSFYFIVLWKIAFVVLFVYLFLILIDIVVLYSTKQLVQAQRKVDVKFSNGDDNHVNIFFQNNSRFYLFVTLVDEVPIQFQLRDFNFKFGIKGFGQKNIDYTLRPTTRGEYVFDNITAFVLSPIGFLERRVVLPHQQVVKVYPSFLQLRQAALKGVVNDEQVGEQKLTKLSSSLEFDHIKEYTLGDDIRNINWKASARKNQLMVNTYNDERSQQIYILLDMSRTMKMPFDGMSLLDHSINSALMLAYTVLHKNDKIGLITFNNKLGDVIKANGSRAQMNKVTEALYKQSTNYLESNYENLMNTVKYKVGQRSLLILYTNFETLISLDRHIQYLRSIAKKHLLCVVIFENTGLKTLKESQAETLEGVYIKTIVDKFHFEKKRIVKELRKEGIISVFTTPQKLSADVMSKYIELKNKRII